MFNPVIRHHAIRSVTAYSLPHRAGVRFPLSHKPSGSGYCQSLISAAVEYERLSWDFQYPVPLCAVLLSTLCANHPSEFMEMGGSVEIFLLFFTDILSHFFSFKPPSPCAGNQTQSLQHVGQMLLWFLIPSPDLRILYKLGWDPFISNVFYKL